MPFRDFKFVKDCLKLGTGIIADGYDYYNDSFKSEITAASALKANNKNFITLKRYGFSKDQNKLRERRGDKWVDMPAYSKSITYTKKAQKFLYYYEMFQGDRVTTLTETLRGYLHNVNRVGRRKVDKNDSKRILVLTASFSDSKKLCAPNFTSTKWVISGDSILLVNMNLSIPRSLCDDVINNTLLRHLSNPNDNNLSRVLQYGESYLDAAARYEMIKSLRDQREVFSWAKTLFCTNASDEEPEHEHAKSEMLRVLFGIIVNLIYVSPNQNSILTIILSIDRHNRQEAFYSRIGNPFLRTDALKKVLGKYLALPFYKPTQETRDETSQTIVSFIKNELSIESPNSCDRMERDLRKGSPEKNFIKALTSSIRLANAYRSVAVHEGQEQSLNIIIGRYADTKSLFRKYSEFPNDMILPALVNSRNLVEIRSKLKACCGALNDKNLAVLVDPSRISEKKDFFRFTHVLRFTPPVFKYPRAKVVSDVIREDEDVALIRVLNRSRMELWYSGRCIACWTNADAHWHVRRTWNRKNLTKELNEWLKVSRSSKAKRMRIATIAEIAMEIASDTNEGGSILLLSDPKFNLGPFHKNGKPKYGTAYNCLKSHIEPMTDCLFDGLSYLDISQRRMHMDKWGEAVIKRLICMDGGTVLNLSTGLLWSRRKFAGPTEFGEKYPVGGYDLKDWWDDNEYAYGDGTRDNVSLYWDESYKYKEWGTRHQSSLALTGLCLKCSNQYACEKSGCPRFVILTMSADGGITLMRKGTVIPPPEEK